MARIPGKSLLALRLGGGEHVLEPFGPAILDPERDGEGEIFFEQFDGWSGCAGHPVEARAFGDRWLALDRVHPAPLLDWRDRIHAAQNSPEAFQDLVAFLAAPNHDSERIKSCSPFAGLSCLNPTE